MVASIRFWLRAFNIIDKEEQPSELGKLLFGHAGFDPYLEDDATLWLLHYHLIFEGIASTYSIIFNELRKEHIEFNRDNYIGFLKRKLEGILNFNVKTVADDFDVFRKMYVGSADAKTSIEDSFSGLLTDLHLVQTIGKGKDERLFIDDSERQTLPCEIVLYSILNNISFGSSISLNNLLFSSSHLQMLSSHFLTNLPAHGVTSSTNLPSLSTKLMKVIPLALATKLSSSP